MGTPAVKLPGQTPATVGATVAALVMDDAAFRKVQAQFATMFADAAGTLDDDSEPLAESDEGGSATTELPLASGAPAAAAGRAIRGEAEAPAAPLSLGAARAARAAAASGAAAAAGTASRGRAGGAGWERRSRVPSGDMALSTLGRNHLAGCVAGRLGVAALPQPAPSARGSPSLLVCPLDAAGALGSAGVPLVPSPAVPSAATLAAVAWSAPSAGGGECWLAAAWASKAAHTVHLWRVAPPEPTAAATAAPPLRVRGAPLCYTATEPVKALAWAPDGAHLAVCLGSSLTLVCPDATPKSFVAAPAALADGALAELLPSAGSKWCALKPLSLARAQQQQGVLCTASLPRAWAESALGAPLCAGASAPSALPAAPAAPAPGVGLSRWCWSG